MKGSMGSVNSFNWERVSWNTGWWLLPLYSWPQVLHQVWEIGVGEIEGPVEQSSGLWTHNPAPDRQGPLFPPLLKGWSENSENPGPSWITWKGVPAPLGLSRLSRPLTHGQPLWMASVISTHHPKSLTCFHKSTQFSRQQIYFRWKFSISIACPSIII